MRYDFTTTVVNTITSTFPITYPVHLSHNKRHILSYQISHSCLKNEAAHISVQDTLWSESDWQFKPYRLCSGIRTEGTELLGEDSRSHGISTHECVL